MDESGKVNFEEMLHFIEDFREAEGFTEEELQRVDGIFMKFDTDVSWEISTS